MMSSIFANISFLLKPFNSPFRTTFSQAIAYYEANEVRGECVVVIKGKDIAEIKQEQINAWEAMDIFEHMAYYENQGMDRKSAMKQVAKDRGIGKRDVYQMLLELE